MAALNPFKKAEKQAPEEPVKPKQKSAEPAVKSGEGGQYLLRPHITEKATDLATQNQYVFVVAKDASKKEIERSVAQLYGVTIEGVRIVNVRPKKMRLGKIKGIKKGYKKAIVHVKKGQAIEVLPT